MYKVLGEQSQDVELERTFIVFQDCMQGHRTPTQVVFTVATFEKYGVKWVWIKSHFKIHLPCDTFIAETVFPEFSEFHVRFIRFTL